MANVEEAYAGAQQPADPDFPHAPADWTRERALGTAHGEGLTLGADHWAAIRGLQEFFARHAEGTVNLRELSDALEEKFHYKGGMKYLYTLFPGGPIAQGSRLAGLKAPAGAIDKSFGSVA
jgi:tRNA 2-thiouridine synthesizing protein E